MKQCHVDKRECVFFPKGSITQDNVTLLERELQDLLALFPMRHVHIGVELRHMHVDDVRRNLSQGKPGRSGSSKTSGVSSQTMTSDHNVAAGRWMRRPGIMGKRRQR